MRSQPRILLFLLLLGSIHFRSEAQSDLCQPQVDGRFWSISDGAIQEWILANGAVSGGATILTAPTTARSLAYCAVNGVPTFYAGSGSNLLNFQNGYWNSVPSGITIKDLGGNGQDLFALQFAFSQTLYRYSGSTMNSIAETAPLFIVAADIAVSDEQLAYVLVGPAQLTASLIRAYNSAGVVVADYPVAFPSVNAYGLLWLNNTLYVAFGPNNPNMPNMLVPFTFVAGAAIQGTPIPFDGAGLNDLTSCTGPGSTGISFQPERTTVTMTAWPVPADDRIEVRFPACVSTATFQFHDNLGRIVGAPVQVAAGTDHAILSLDGLKAGVYALSLRGSDGSSALTRVIVQHGR